MQSLNSIGTTDEQWRAYQQLELIPDHVPNPRLHSPRFAFGCDWAWRQLIRLLIDELVTEQQVEYLDRCYALNEGGESNKPSSTLQKLWVLMN